MTNHARHKHREYGLECVEYDALAADQDGKCGICEKPGPLVIDHDHRHDMRAVRGLLCAPCNTSLRPVDAGRKTPTEAERRYLDGAWHLRHRPNLPPLPRIPSRMDSEASPVGVGEIALLLGVSRQRVQQLAQKPDFPEPWRELWTGLVWRDSDIEAWLPTRNTRRGRPRKT